MEDILNQTLDSLRAMVDSDTVIGRTIVAPDNATWVVPVSRLSVGLVTGSGDYAQGKQEAPYSAGGGGAGGSVSPVGFLVMRHEGVHFLPVDHEETANKWMGLINSALDVIKAKR